MARLNYRQLKADYDLLRKERREGELFDTLESAIEDGDIKSRDFNVRECWEETVEGGSEVIRAWKRGHESDIMEAGGNPTDAFGRITERIIRGEVLESFADPAFVGDQVCTTRSTDAYDGERLPGMTRLGDASEEVGIGQPYPETTFTEDYLDLPATVKKGNIVSLAKEHVMADQTGLLLDRAAEVGYWLGYNKEIRILGCVLGTDGSLYKRRERIGVQVYNNNTGDHDWDNLDSNTFIDWTSIQQAEVLFDKMTDPNTGEPILIIPDTIICPTALKHDVRRVVNATSVQHQDRTVAVDMVGTISASPLDPYNIVSSTLVYKKTTSDTTWYIGQPKRAFQYRENWPVTVSQQGAGSDDEFTRDIVMKFKASERGVCVPVEPRYMVKNT